MVSKRIKKKIKLKKSHKYIKKTSKYVTKMAKISQENVKKVSKCKQINKKYQKVIKKS